MQGDRLTTNHARDRTADDHPLARDHSRHLTFLTDYDFSGQHVTLDLAVDLKDSTADDPKALADDLEVVPNDRFLAG